MQIQRKSFCPSCGALNLGIQTQCMVCQTPLAEPELPSNLAGETRAELCSQCGAALKPGKKFCTKCGHPVPG
jgi:hypothetical protein